MDNQHLTHAGIKGMRWGVRRFQNKDGSLTPEGKKRYGVDDDNDSHEEYKRARSKSVRSMSDKELADALNRVRMEQQYKELTKVEKSAARKWVEGVVAESGKQIATKFVTSAATAGMGVALRKVYEKTGNDSMAAFAQQMVNSLGAAGVMNGAKRAAKKVAQSTSTAPKNEGPDTPSGQPKTNTKQSGYKTPGSDAKKTASPKTSIPKTEAPPKKDTPKTDTKKSTSSKTTSNTQKTKTSFTDWAKSKVSTGPMKDESDRPSGNSSKSSKTKKGYDYVWEASFEDVPYTSTSKSSTSYKSTVNNNPTVAGLLSAPVAGLLPAPKKKD